MDDINYKRRSEQAYYKIKQLLLEKKWQAGELLSTYTLSKMLNTSRTTIMTALKALEKEGYIVIEPQVGCFIRTPTSEYIKEQFYIRAALEGLAAEMASAGIPDDTIAKLEWALQESKNAIYENVIEKYQAMNEIIHLTIAEASRMPHLQAMVREFWEKTVYFSGAFMFLQQRREISLIQHRSIIEALKMRDGMTAKQRLESHLRAGGDDLVRYLYNNKPS